MGFVSSCFESARADWEQAERRLKELQELKPARWRLILRWRLLGEIARAEDEVKRCRQDYYDLFR